MSARTVQLRSHLKTVLLSQDARVDRFDDGVLVQGEVQRLGGAAGRQQGLMGVGLFEALHQTGPGRRESRWLDVRGRKSGAPLLTEMTRISKERLFVQTW